MNRVSRQRFLLLAIASALLLVLTTPLFAEERPTLDHPAIKEVLAMSEAGIRDFVISERIDQIKQVPVLTGEDLAVLKSKGVSDIILQKLIRAASRAEKKQAPATPQPAPAMPGPTPVPAVPERLSADPPAPEPLPEGAGRIEISLNGRFRISYYEVFIDGVKVAEKGAILEGQSDPGMVLSRAHLFKPKNLGVIYTEILPTGKHEVLVGYAISEVDSDPEDLLHEYSRETYVSRGVHAEEKAAASGGWGPNRAVVCQLEQGQICSVTAYLKEKKSHRFGGIPNYTIKYKAKVSATE